jgi:methanogenic corrinoid protein MtbC1
MTTTYSIAAVANMTGISIDTLRAWERRYSIVTPARDRAGVRRYSERDVARLELARSAVALGHPIRVLAGHSNAKLRQLIGAAKGRSADSGMREAVVGDIVAAVRRYDAGAAEDALNAAALLLPVPALVLEILVPLLQRIGALWEACDISVGHEHLASNLIRNLIGSIARLHGSRGGSPVLFATPSGEMHEFGIALAACLAAERGYRPYVLGANVPADEVARAARGVGPTVVVVGAVLCTDHDAVNEYIDRLGRRLPRHTALWAGGEGLVRAISERAPGRAEPIATLAEFARRIARRTLT